MLSFLFCIVAGEFANLALDAVEHRERNDNMNGDCLSNLSPRLFGYTLKSSQRSRQTFDEFHGDLASFTPVGA